MPGSRTQLSRNNRDDGTATRITLVNLIQECGSSDAYINFDSTVFATAQTITLGGTQLELSDTTGATTITGPATGVTVDANHTSRVFMIDTGVTAALSGLTITGGNGNGVGGDGGGVFNRGTATLTNCTISSNVASANGGGVFSVGPLALSQCIISNNSALGVNASVLFDASGFGGGVLALLTQSTFDLCTIAGNSAPLGGGGGIGNFYGSSSFTDCAITSNTAAYAGVYSIGNLGMTNCTISSNTATLGAGGIVVGGTGLLTNCTISGNSAPVAGGLVADGDIKLTNTIVAGNTATDASPDVYGTVNSQGYNLIGQTDGSTGWVGTDLTGTTASPLDAMLAPLGNYGGTTQTMPLLPGSPAIGAGTTTGAPSTDQRGLIRGSIVDIGATQASLAVMSNSGAVDTTAGGLTLPGAVSLANQFGGANSITFDSTVFATPQTITLAGTQLELSDTTGATTITGPAAGVTVDANNASRVFQIDAGVTADFTGLTISGGNSGNGGGLMNDHGTTTITNCTISGNTVSGGGSGGGVLNFFGTLTLTNSTISGNTVTGSGGGGGLLTYHGSATLTNCTISGNSAEHNSGGIYNPLSPTTMTNTIVAGNFVGTDPWDVRGSINSQGYNLIGVIASSTGWISTDLTDTNAYLSVLGNYGGPTQTVALLPGSPAIDAGTSTGAPSTDQRGQSRVGGVDIGAFESRGFSLSTVAGNTPQSADISTQFSPLAVAVAANNPIEPVDGGIVNYQTQSAGNGATAIFLARSPATIVGGQASLPAMPNNALGSYTVAANANGGNSVSLSLTNTGQVFASLVVNTTSNTPAPGVGILSLPEAVLFVNNDLTGGQTISFDSSVFATHQTITLAGSALELAKDVTITGPAAGVTVDANHASRVFKIDAGVTAALSGLTITGGTFNSQMQWNFDGGGGVSNAGTATLTNCTVTGNSSIAWGAGLANQETATLVLINSTVSDNTAEAGGGGVANLGTLTVTRSTITHNTSPNYGGGVLNVATATLTDSTIDNNSGILGAGVLNASFLGTFAQITLTNCTLSGNTATNSGGGFASAGNAELTNCTISGNSAASGGGVFAYSGDIKLTNTIVAGNTATTSNPDVTGTVDSQGNNLIGQTDGSTGWVGSDLTDTAASPLDAMLAPLGNYGGPTQTMPLQAGSPAIDAGTSTGAPSTDQRGFARVGAIDIGAFQSGSLVVNTTADSLVTPSGILDLRQAINLANVQTGDDAISFDSTVFATPQTITLGGTQLELSDSTGATTITGPATGVTVDANHTSRVFMIDSGVTAELSSLTITGGYTYDDPATIWDGGGIYNAGTLALDQVAISHNSGNLGGGIFNDSAATLTINNSSVSQNDAGQGGGIFGEGTLVIANSHISGNSSSSRGGGLYISGGTATLDQSTISGNSSGNGAGGIYNGDSTTTITNCLISGNTSDGDGGGVLTYYDSTLSITNSTLSGNTAAYNGGGIYASYAVSLTNTTITGNSASQGGGIYVPVWSDPTSLSNTIIAGNTATDASPDAYGSVSSQGFNLIGQTDGSTGWVGSDLTGTTASPLDPLLAPLGNYGGPTQTMALLPGSPAINAGTSTGAPTTDQRGSSRVGGVDIGAFESQGFTLTPVANSTPQAAYVDALFSQGLGVTVTANNPVEPVNGGFLTFNTPGSGASATLSAGKIVIAGGAASVSATANHTAGAYNVTANASGAPAAATFALTNTALASTTSLTSSANPSTVGSSVIFTATVTSGATGTVTFKDGSTVLGTATISGTTATFSTAGLSAGSHSITAVYGGDSTYDGSTSSAITQVVNKASTNTSLTSSANPSTLGDTVIFTATVTSGATGTVTFKDGSTVLGTATISGTTATFSTAALSAGSHSITAVYGGDSAYDGSTSSAITQVVAAAPVVTSNPTGQTVNAGATATFTAAGIGNPAPTVQWQVSTNGGSSWANISGATGTSYTTAATTAGNDGSLYRAVFINSLGSAATSAATLRVNQAPAITGQPNSVSANSGSTVTFSATATGSPAPTVQWQSNNGGGWTNISGATSTSYSTLASGNSGTQFRAVFTNTFGTATSNAATLTIAVVANVSSTSVGWGTQTANLVDAGNGRLLPAGRTTSIPWLGINKITLTLDQSITSLAASNVTLKSAAGFTYSVASVTGSGTTWTINLAGTGLANADKVTVTVGNSNLASYSKRLDVLPGDVNDDGLVSSVDQLLVSRGLTGQYIVFYDVDGSGTLTSADVNTIKTRIGNRLPA